MIICYLLSILFNRVYYWCIILGSQRIAGCVCCTVVLTAGVLSFESSYWYYVLRWLDMAIYEHGGQFEVRDINLSLHNFTKHTIMMAVFCNQFLSQIKEVLA